MSVFSPLAPELSLSWEKQVSSSIKTCQFRVCARGNVSHFMCSVKICIKGSLYCPGGGGGAVMSPNAATKASTHDKFSTERGSHRCCETFRPLLETCQPYLSPVLTRSMPHRQFVYPQVVPN